MNGDGESHVTMPRAECGHHATPIYCGPCVERLVFRAEHAEAALAQKGREFDMLAADFRRVVGHDTNDREIVAEMRTLADVKLYVAETLTEADAAQLVGALREALAALERGVEE